MSRRLADLTAVACVLTLAVSGLAHANPVPADSKESINLRQVNTYLLQAVATFRRREQDLQAKITKLTEANARLNILLNELETVRKQAVAAEGQRRAAVDQLNQERRATKAQRDQAAALSRINERLNTSLREAQRDAGRAAEALQRLRSEHTSSAEEAKNFKRQLKRSLELERESAQLRQSLVETHEELERLRKAHEQLTHRDLRALQEENLALQARLVTLEEENQRRQQAVEQLRAIERDRQAWTQERVQIRLEADTLRQMLQRERADKNRDLGAAYTKLQMFDKAIAAYELALEAHPDHAQTHYYLGLLYEHAQNNDERAVAHLQRYLALSPKLPPKVRKEIEYVINMLQTKEPPAK